MGVGEADPYLPSPNSYLLGFRAQSSSLGRSKGLGLFY